MIAVRVAGPIEIAAVGAPSYFAGRRPPRTPDDLASHSGIHYRLGAKGPIAKFEFERDGKTRRVAVPGRLTVNTIELALHAALDGLGIARVPEAVPPYGPTDPRIGELVGGGGSSLPLLSWTPAGSARAASVHRHGSRPEMNHGRTSTQSLLSP
jgi:DNA-binding transcriptional LysR family regulator